MNTASIRELSRGTSALMKRVRKGETFTITDNGAPVAMLGPVSDGTRAKAPPVSDGTRAKAPPVSDGTRAKAPPVACQPEADPAPPPPPDGAPPLVRLRWMQAVAERSVRLAADERTRTLALKEARTIAEKLGKLSGELAVSPNPRTNRFERMSPREIVAELEAMLAEARIACR